MFSYLDLQTHGIWVVLNLYFVLVLITIVLQNVDYSFQNSRRTHAFPVVAGQRHSMVQCAVNDLPKGKKKQ